MLKQTSNWKFFNVILILICSSSVTLVLALVLIKKQTPLRHKLSVESYQRYLLLSKLNRYKKAKQELEQAQDIIEEGVDTGTQIIEAAHMLIRQIPRELKPLHHRTKQETSLLNWEKKQDEQLAGVYKSIRDQNKQIHGIIRSLFGKKN